MFNPTYSHLASMQRRNTREARGVEPVVYIFDVEMRRYVRVTQIVEFTGQMLLNDTGQARLVIPATSMWAGVTVGVHPDASIPVVTEWITDQSRLRQVWFTTHVVETFTGDTGTIELHLVTPEAHLEHLHAWVNPSLLPEAQISKTKITAGPVAEVVKRRLLEGQFKRVNAKLAQILRDPNPIHVVKPTVSRDLRSKSVLVNWKFDQVLEVVKDLLDVEHLTLTCDAYIHGVDGQPWAGANLKQSCLVWDVVPRVELPEGGLVLDVAGGIINTVSDLWDTVWDFVTGYTDTIGPQSATAHNFWGEPRFILREGQYQRCEVVTQKPTSSMFTVGGQSPQWFNNLLGMGIGALVSMIAPVLSIVVNVTGLNNILNNRLMSYHSFDDWERRKRMGRFGFIETFTPTTALSIDALFEIRRAQWKTRAVRTYTAEYEPGVGLAVGRPHNGDTSRALEIGTMVALELPGQRFVIAWVTAMDFTWSADSAPAWKIQIGERAVRSPVESVYRGIKNIALLANKLTLTE